MSNTLNAATLALNGASEACRLIPYDDARPDYTLKPGDKVLGTLTQGWGHTGADIKIGYPWTQAQADQVRTADLRKAADIVEAVVRVPLTDNQYGVLVDFAFNVGRSNFIPSTLVAKLNAGDYAAVPDQLARWVYATVKGKKVKVGGLVERRQREAFLWNVPDDKSEQAISAFSPATQPSVTAAPIPNKTLLTSATAYSIAAAATIPLLASPLQEAATQISQFSDVAPFIPRTCHYMGIGAACCALFGKLRSLRQRNDSQAT